MHCLRAGRRWLLAGVLLGWGVVAGLPAAETRSAPPFRAERRLPKAPNIPPDPPEVLIGERLFLETRFAQFFAVRCGGDVNTNLPAGDPVLDTVTTPSASLPGRFRGQSMNCRACHPVSEYRRAGGGNRNYADYAARTPIPSREDGLALTLRNSQPLVNATVPREVPQVLHNDGEFATTEELVMATFTGRNYGWHLRTLIDHGQWRFDVTEHHGWFRFLSQRFQFSTQELAGLRIFFNIAQDRGLQRNPAGGVGNCIACHAAPHFTDFGFHNTGVAQEEYDGVHGAGAFSRIEVPDLATRARDPSRWLGPTPQHPVAVGVFLAIPGRRFPGRTDLGLWNVFANPDHPLAQDPLRQLLDPDAHPRDDARLLPLTLARFKTPTLRGLSFSEPYFHNGQAATLEEAIGFYVRASELARADQLRNAAPEWSGIRLTGADIAPLAALLRALNEDYE